MITIAGLLGQINQNQKIEQTLDEKIAAVREAEEILQRIEPRLEILEEAVPSEAMWGKFAGDVGLVATDSGITLRSMVINPIEGEEKGKLAMWNFTMSGEGGYANMRRFVNELENMRRVVIVTTVDVIRIREGEVTLNLAGKLGFLPDSI